MTFTARLHCRTAETHAHASSMADKKSKTLFIRNLPFSATNDKLSEVFGEVGPIKTAFVVKQKGTI